MVGQVVKTSPPKGFEDVDNSVATLFDVSYAGRKLGTFNAVYRGGRITFSDPAKIAAALGAHVDGAAVIKLLTGPLDANEAFRCKPGQSPNFGCGLLPSGQAGVIVNVETFDVTLFLSRQYLADVNLGPALLGPPTAGASLIQGVRLSGAGGGSTRLRYGGTFDTLASIGRTSLVAQTTLSDQDGARLGQAYAQRIWSDRRAAAGILQDFQSFTLTSYRVLGAEYGSFYGTYLDAENDTATPLEVVLPRRAQVEIYREGVLIATGQYEGGLQLLDTRSLPSGSYAVRLVARDGGAVLFDETRSFSKMGNLVPPGKTAFRLRIGERVQDFFATTTNGVAHQSFIPATTGELVVSAFAQRRLGRSFATTATVTSFDARVFGEVAVQMFKGRISGIASVGAGSDNTRSAFLTGIVQLRDISFSLSARTTRSDAVTGLALSQKRYNPFFRNEDTIFGAAQFHILGGSLGVSGGYTRSDLFPRTYTATVQYSRSVALPLVGSSLLTAYASSSDVDRRIGLSVSFFRAVDRKTSLSFSGGGQYVSGNGDGARNGPSPVAEAVVTRTQQIGSVDVISQAGATTDADSNRLFAQARANSSFGALDTTVQYQTRNAGNSGLTYIGNLQTGIAIGGGAVKIGLRSPADSMVIVDLRNLTSATKKGDAVVVSTADAPEATSENLAVADGGYRITVNDKAFDYIAPGKRVAIGLPALKQYRVGLKPEGAPQFDIDAAQRAVTLYPGNVVTLRFEAKRVVTIFGQILDPSGSPVASARVEAGSDVALADDQGYFTITAPLAAAIDIVRPGGATCLRRPLASLIDPRQPSLLYRVGKLVCASAVTTPKRTGEAQPIATDRADRAAGSSPLPTTIERVPFLPAETSGSALPPSPLLGASLPTFRELADVARGAIARITEATPKERSSPISTPQPPIAAATRTSGMDEEDFATPIDVVALPRATLSSIPPEPAKSVEALIAAARLAIERLSPTKIA